LSFILNYYRSAHIVGVFDYFDKFYFNAPVEALFTMDSLIIG